MASHTAVIVHWSLNSSPSFSFSSVLYDLQSSVSETGRENEREKMSNFSDFYMLKIISILGDFTQLYIEDLVLWANV